MNQYKPSQYGSLPAQTNYSADNETQDPSVRNSILRIRDINSSSDTSNVHNFDALDRYINPGKNSVNSNADATQRPTLGASNQSPNASNNLAGMTVIEAPSLPINYQAPSLPINYQAPSLPINYQQPTGPSADPTSQPANSSNNTLVALNQSPPSAQHSILGVDSQTPPAQQHFPENQTPDALIQKPIISPIRIGNLNSSSDNSDSLNFGAFDDFLNPNLKKLNVSNESDASTQTVIANVNAGKNPASAGANGQLAQQNNMPSGSMTNRKVKYGELVVLG